VLHCVALCCGECVSCVGLCEYIPPHPGVRCIAHLTGGLRYATERWMLHCIAVCRSVSQCVAVCRSVSQCVAVCRSVLQCVAVCRSVSQCVAVCRSVSQCVAVCRSVLQCVAVCRSVSQCIAGYCSVRQCVAVCCSELQWVALYVCVSGVCMCVWVYPHYPGVLPIMYLTGGLRYATERCVCVAL